MGRRITWMSEAALVRMQKMHRSDENGDDGDHWFGRHHHHRRLRREMQEKENCCNIGGIEGVTAQLANFQRTWVSLTQGTGLAKAFSRNRYWQHLVKPGLLAASALSLFCCFVWHQTNQQWLRLSISPKKGYDVEFSTVATEWSWEWFLVDPGPRSVPENISREFCDLQLGVQLPFVVNSKTSFALEVPGPPCFGQATQ